MDLDEVDRRVLYALGSDARHTSAPDIAADLDVSAATVRNRIRRLEAEGVVLGYHAHVDYERADGLLTNLFLCDAGVEDRERLAQQALSVPGVVNVREVMTGREDLHVEAVGTDADDLARIGRSLSELGLDIQDEDLVHREHFHPYHEFSPGTAERRHPLSNFRSLGDRAAVAEVTVAEGAPVAGHTLERANAEGLLDGDVVVVAVRRDEEVIAPHGDTVLQVGDLVTVFGRDGVDDDLLATFD